MSRAALVFVSAAAAAGCGGTEATNVQGDSGPRDAAGDARGDASQGDEGGAVVMYGPAPIDSGGPREAGAGGTDGGNDSATDAGNGVPLYGAPPFDAGRRVPPGR
jgi:hypothetical protein